MSDKKNETLQDKKKELEAELRSIQDELDESLDRVKADVSSSLDPVEYIKRHPLPVVGLAVLVGFLAGKEGGNQPSRAPGTGTTDHKISATLWYEIKRLAARKAMSRLGDYIDDIF